MPQGGAVKVGDKSQSRAAKGSDSALACLLFATRCAMVLILVGKSEIGAHVQRIIGYSICAKHLSRWTAVKTTNPGSKARMRILEL